MKAVLFCYHPYAFGILKPLHDQLNEAGHAVLWYVRPALGNKFPFAADVKWSAEMSQISAFAPDVIFVPGNEVPDYLRGIKVQVFHGLAGEKKGHFRIRHYFDLYLTQGPYFTAGFKNLAKKHKDFEVVETGWCKLDPLLSARHDYGLEKKALLEKHQALKVILYAPTFSPSLTSAPSLLDEMEKIAGHNEILLMIKYHDLMDEVLKDQYKQRLAGHPRVIFAQEPNILKYLVMADLMISDTSSVVYEFMLLDKPVVTFRSSSQNILWNNISDPGILFREVMNELEQDTFKIEREQIIHAYHPYDDGASSRRMIEAVEDYITRKGIPERRKLGLYRRRKVRRLFGPNPLK